MRTKICGITDLKEAIFSIEQGAWALGFNFHPSSPRYLTKEAAKQMIEQLPTTIIKVGIFVKVSYETLTQYADVLSLDLFQIYHPVQAPDAFKDRIILSLQATHEKDLPPQSLLDSYGYLLLDAPLTSENKYGGTGKQSNWHLAALLARQHRLILAGGLNSANVKAAIQTVHPYAVDVASGVETVLGKKDPILIQQFLQACQDE